MAKSTLKSNSRLKRLKILPKRANASYLLQNNHKILYATIEIKDLFDYCFVSRRSDKPIDGFQRSLNINRAKDIANYLDSGQGSIPTPIILSAQDEAQLKYDINKQILTYYPKKFSFLVIDGQHRLFGYHLATKNYKVPVAIYFNLTKSDEVKLFIDINTNQRGVPASLLLDIKYLAERETSTEEKLRKLFNKLNTESSSPLAGLLSPNENKKGKVTRVTFNRAFDKLYENNVFSKISEEKQYELLRNYFKALDATTDLKSLVVKSAYFEAFAELFYDTINMSISKRKNLKQSTILEILQPIKATELKSINIGGNARLTKTHIKNIMLTAISNNMDVTDDLV